MAGLGTLNGGLGKWRIWAFSGKNGDFLLEIGEFREKILQIARKPPKNTKKRQKLSAIYVVRHSADPPFSAPRLYNIPKSFLTSPKSNFTITYLY